MSPTATRSLSSSHSQDRDRISSHSRGSVASSGDDDVDSVQSIYVGSLDRLASKRTDTFLNTRAMAFSKKSTRIMSPSSAPKRSFDSALRQMDHRKSPQKMFRPLLSSVPSSTFYVGKKNSAHRPLISRNSSVTTSSNASSDQGTSGAPDTEGSDHHQEDMANESGKTAYSDAQEEVFAFDKVDTLNKDVRHDTDDVSHFRVGEFDRNPAIECEPNDSEEFGHPEIDMEIISVSDALCIKADFSEVDSTENKKVCSKCGCKYRAIEMIEKDLNVCPDCSRQDNLVAATCLETIIVAPENSSVLSLNVSEQHKPCDEHETQMAITKLKSQVTDEEARVIQQGDDVKHGQAPCHEQSDSYSHESSLVLVEGDEQRIASQHGAGQPTLSHRIPESDFEGQQLLRSGDYRSLKVDVSEGAGISVLLKSGDGAKSLRSSFGHGSTSASSSIDFSSGRQVETRVQRQLSGRKYDMDNYSLATSTHEENSEAFVGNVKHEVIEGATVTSHGKVAASENNDMGVSSASFTGIVATEGDSCEHNDVSRIMDASTSSLSCHAVGIQLEENSVASFLTYEDRHLHESEVDFPNNAISVSDVEASVISPDPPVEMEHTMLNSCVDGLNDVEVPTHSSLASISEIETENFCQGSPGSEYDDVSTNSKSSINEFQDHSIPTPSDKEMSASVLEHSNSDHLHVILEDSTVLVRKGSKARSLTLEEATDTILFCSSIVHDLAYQAAALAIEKEDSVALESSRPTVTVVGKSTADRKDSRSRTTGKSTSKSLKARQKRTESDVKSPSSKFQNDENANETMLRNVGLPNNIDSAKPPKLESKCNCTIM
ncbi:hypothetical protein GH714_017527 [Hevea brasiliensis]|uniref:Uncharacterized protein n=1 Tax=Hevea brasiliensis TaxID=3981 RepID=A0A6A6KG82_HEVBR|nr:hypothetical protein GH714_017527 [Hevea brasiliensis]